MCTVYMHAVNINLMGELNKLNKQKAEYKQDDE